MGYIFANYTSGKGLTAKICKEHKQLNGKKKNPIWLKNGQRIEYRHFPPRRHINGQQVHEEVLSITNYQGNSSINSNELSPHIC